MGSSVMSGGAFLPAWRARGSQGEPQTSLEVVNVVPQRGGSKTKKILEAGVRRLHLLGSEGIEGKNPYKRLLSFLIFRRRAETRTDRCRRWKIAGRRGCRTTSSKKKVDRRRLTEAYRHRRGRGRGDRCPGGLREGQRGRERTSSLQPLDAVIGPPDSNSWTPIPTGPFSTRNEGEGRR